MEYLYDGPVRAKARLILAHGAGAPMDSPFMERIAGGVAQHGIRVCRFEFPYMAKRRIEGTRGGPDRAPVLTATWHEVIEAHRHKGTLFIGGKSMGGRYATMVCDGAGVDGVVCLGYPFHPPGKPGRPRIEHLEALKTPCMILQGTRDALGTQDEVTGYRLSRAISVRFFEDGDHSLKPRKRSGRTEEQALDEAIEAIAAFIADTAG